MIPQIVVLFAEYMAFSGAISEVWVPTNCGRFIGELSQEYAHAGLSISDTLEIRPGYSFMAMVNKDIHLRPYVNHRSAGGTIPIKLGQVVQ